MILTREEIKTISKANISEPEHLLMMAKAEIFRYYKSDKDFDLTIFLSHSHSDSALLEDVITIFLKMNIEVYVDWLDEDLTYPPSGKTANRIKKKIKENKKFILLATNNAISSKWCNWELGLGDAAKYIENIAIFPVAENSGQWIGNEYLQVDPDIEKHSKLTEHENYSIIYPDGKKIKLEQWMKN